MLNVLLVDITNLDRNESFTFAAGPYTPKVFVWIHDHKTLGKDKLLGDGEVDVRICLISLYILSHNIFIFFRSGDTYSLTACQLQMC